MLVAALLLPALSHGHHECRINCTNNLKQIGLSFKTWSLDNQDRLPMDVPVTEGGAKEALAQGKVYVAFQVMSNELSTPKVLVCPNDQQRQALTGAMWAIVNTNISYFVCQDPSQGGNPGILTGDRNLINQISASQHYVPFTKELVLAWTKEMHRKKGNVGFADGSVMLYDNGALVIKREGGALKPNRLVVP